MNNNYTNYKYKIQIALMEQHYTAQLSQITAIKSNNHTVKKILLV